MAAAALSGSRGVAGSLYFLVTLLCLVCLASSRLDNDKLKNLKEDLQKVDQNIDHLKAKRATFSEIMSVYVGFTEPMMALLAKFLEISPDDFLPLKGVLDSAMSVMEHTKTFVDEQNEKLDASVANLELEVGRNKKCLKAFEEYRAEL